MSLLRIDYHVENGGAKLHILPPPQWELPRFPKLQVEHREQWSVIDVTDLGEPRGRLFDYIHERRIAESVRVQFGITAEEVFINSIAAYWTVLIEGCGSLKLYRVEYLGVRRTECKVEMSRPATLGMVHGLRDLGRLPQFRLLANGEEIIIEKY